jgi:hypothetical protein
MLRPFRAKKVVANRDRDSAEKSDCFSTPSDAGRGSRIFLARFLETVEKVAPRNEMLARRASEGSGQSKGRLGVRW